MLLLFVFIRCTLSTKHYGLTLIHHLLSSEDGQLPHLFALFMLLTRLSSCYPVLLNLLSFLSGCDHKFGDTCRCCLQAQ